MKGIKVVIFSGCLFCTTMAAAQADIFATIKEAIKDNDAKKTVEYFHQVVDLNLAGESNTYSKAEARLKLENFFNKNSKANFNIVHTGSSPNGLKFAIGRYQTESQNYSVLIRVKEAKKKYLVYEISFIEE